MRFRTVPFVRLTRRRLRAISPLTVRILTVNLVALAIPIVGSLFLAQYQHRLITNELGEIETDAKLYAVAIAEGCVTSDPDDNEFIMPTLARQMIRHLVGTSTIHSQLYDTRERLLADSHQLVGPGGTVQLEELPPPQRDAGVGERVMNHVNAFLNDIPGRTSFPRMPGRGMLDGQVMQVARVALGGSSATKVWNGREGGLVFMAAAPVQNLESVLGVVTVVHDGREIDSAVRSLRLDMLKVSGVGLAITTILSVYLAGKISRPLRKLAAAAIAQTQDVGQGQARRIEIPDFGIRRDEIGDLSVALREMTEALWHRMDAIERFAADVAHELKNPLTSMRSAIETAGRISDPDQKTRLMAIVADDVSRMDRLISDISNASRLDAELSRLEAQPVGLVEMLGMAVELGRSQELPVTISYIHDPEDRTRVLGIEGRLMQVFQNLIDNALSFAPPGSAVTVRLTGGERDVIVTVDDEGPGIPERKLGQIFDRFYTERPESEAFGKHSGLGLSIARQIVDAHKGRIYAENRGGRNEGQTGARLVVILPRYTKKAA